LTISPLHSRDREEEQQQASQLQKERPRLMHLPSGLALVGDAGLNPELQGRHYLTTLSPIQQIKRCNQAAQSSKERNEFGWREVEEKHRKLSL
jgi:hypothetical protein